jgi:hypothetical protein
MVACETRDAGKSLFHVQPLIVFSMHLLQIISAYGYWHAELQEQNWVTGLPC